MNLQRKGNIVENGHVGPDGEGLKYHAQAPLLRRNVDILFFVGHHLAAQRDGTVRQILEAGNHTQCGSLTTARGPQEGKALPLLDIETEVVDCGHGAKRFGSKCFYNMLQYNLIHIYPLFLSFVINLTRLLQIMMRTMVTTDKAAAGAIWPLIRSW